MTIRHRKKGDHATKGRGIRKPIRFSTGLHLASYAEGCGWEPDRLRRASVRAIRTRHHEATILEKARGRRPNIYRLGFNSVEVIYTLEPDAAVIHGYFWERDPESFDEFDGGWYECEPAWFRPTNT